jgi:transposase
MVKPRRTYTPEFKVRGVLEMLTSKKSLSQASWKYGIKDSVLSRWRQEFLERAPQIFEQGKAEDGQAQRIAATIDFRQEIALLPYSDRLTPLLLTRVPEEARFQSWWLILCDGTLVPGNRGGCVALLSAMKVTRMIGRLVVIYHLSSLLDALDRRLAVWRRWLSRFVPEGRASHRYP